MMTNEEARVLFRYHFSHRLMEKLPAKCLCGHKVGDGTHLLVCKKVNAGQIAAHDVAVRMIKAKLNLYGVEPYEVRNAAENLKNNKYADLVRNKNHEFVSLVVDSLGGLGRAAVKLFAEIARSQTSSSPPALYGILLCVPNRHKPDCSTER